MKLASSDDTLNFVERVAPQQIETGRENRRVQRTIIKDIARIHCILVIMNSVFKRQHENKASVPQTSSRCKFKPKLLQHEKYVTIGRTQSLINHKGNTHAKCAPAVLMHKGSMEPREKHTFRIHIKSFCSLGLLDRHTTMQDL